MPLSREETPQVEQAADASGKTAGNAGQLSPSVSSAEKAWKRLNEIRALLRLTPFDVSTEAGRSKERYRRAALTALASASARGMAILTMLITVPLTVSYLGMERYGLWMTIGSLTVMLAFADLGMGNGLLNAVSEAHGMDQREAAREYVSSALFMLSGIAAVVLVCFISIYPVVPWTRVFNLSSPQAMAEAGPAVAVFIGCFALNLPLGVTQKVQMGYQEGFTISLWNGLGSLFSLVGVLLVIYLKAGLPWLVLAVAGLPALTTFCNGIVLFGFQRPWLLPKWQSATWLAAKRIFRLGMLFFALQVSMALMNASDNIVATQLLGPQAVTQYSVPVRLFNIAPALLAMILTPLWPAYGEAIARGDVAWVKKTLVRSLVGALLLCGLPSLVLVAFGPSIIRVWVGPQIAPSFMLLLGLGVFSLLAVFGNSVAMLLNAASIMRFQVVTALLMGSSSLLAKIFLCRKAGLAGLIWGTNIAAIVFSAIPLIVYVPGVLRRLVQRRPFGTSG